jgi:UDP-glucose 4-epimerase
MNKIIILGGSGFLGKSLHSELKKESFQVKTMIHANNVESKSEKFKGNVLSKSSLDPNISKGDTVINLVGQFSGDVSNFINLNIEGGLNILNTCVKKKASHLILISTINVYGENIVHPSKETDIPKTKNFYGVVKLATEKIYENYAKVFGLNVTILRFSHIYGPGKKVGIISDLLSPKNKSYNLFNNGKQQRDFIYVDDAVNGIIQAINLHKKGFSTFNISSGIRYSTKDLVKMIEKISNRKMKITLNPKIPDEKCIWADNSKAEKILKFKPRINIKKGLQLQLQIV